MHLLIKQVAEGEADKLDKFFSVNTYVQGSYTEKSAFDGLNKALLELEKGKTVGNRLIYLALPPSVFEPVTSFIKQSCMSKTQVVFISHTHTHTHTHTYTMLSSIFSVVGIELLLRNHLEKILRALLNCPHIWLACSQRKKSIVLIIILVKRWFKTY